MKITDEDRRKVARNLSAALPRNSRSVITDEDRTMVARNIWEEQRRSEEKAYQEKQRQRQKEQWRQQRREQWQQWEQWRQDPQQQTPPMLMPPFPFLSPEDEEQAFAMYQMANDYAQQQQQKREQQKQQELQPYPPLPMEFEVMLDMDKSPRTREAKIQANPIIRDYVKQWQAMNDDIMATAQKNEEILRRRDAMSFEDVNAEYEQRKANYEAQRIAYGREAVAKSGISAANTYQIKAVFDQATAQFDAEHADERGGIEALKRYIQDRWETKESDEAKFAAHVAEVQNAPDFEEKAPSWENYNQRTVSALFGATNQDEAAYYRFSKHATELEKKTFLYLLETEGKKAAKQYLKSVFPTINARSNEELEQKLTPYVGDSWIENAAKRLGGAGLSILAGTAGAVAYLGESAGQLFSNAGKEWYEQEHGIQEDSMTANLFQQRNIGTEAVLQGTSGVGRFVASLALSGVENGVDFLLFQGAAPYIMSLKAGAQGAYNVYERGGTAEQQGSAFLCNAAAELLGEKVSFNKLKQVLADPSTGLNAWLRRWGAQSLSESGEEMATEVMNIISDIAIMKDDAEVAQKLDQMIAEGKKNPELALAISVALQLLQAGASGVLTSVIMTAPGNIQNLQETSRSRGIGEGVPESQGYTPELTAAAKGVPETRGSELLKTPEPERYQKQAHESFDEGGSGSESAWKAADRGSQTQYLSEDGRTGVSIGRKDGEIGSWFSERGKELETLNEAVRLGGKKLADYDGERNRFYEASGFVAESRADFDPKQAPKGWDYEKQGKPDILFWRYAGEEAAQAAKPTDVESLWKSNYEAAEEWRDTEIRKAEEENANKTVEEEKQPTNEHMVDKKPKSDIIKEEKDSEDDISSKHNKIPENDSIVKHIFRVKKGHLLDTPENRALLEEVSNEDKNFKGRDRYGNEWYSKILDDGRQVWVETRNNNIIEGGINDNPATWDESTGYKRPNRP